MSPSAFLSSIIIIVLLLVSSSFERLQSDMGFETKVPGFIKQRIDQLVNQKAKMYLTTFFEELGELENDRLNNSVLSYGKTNSEEKISRVRRNTNQNDVESFCDVLVPLGFSNGVIRNSQIVSSSVFQNDPNFSPSQARLNIFSGWCSRTTSRWADEWIQVDLLEQHLVFGIALQGHAHPKNQSQYVTMFVLESSLDGVSFITVKDGKGNQMVFDGTLLQTTVFRWLPRVLKARYVRFIATELSQGSTKVCARLELFGCGGSSHCKHIYPLGVESHQIPDSQLSGSTGNALLARLNNHNGFSWCATSNNRSQEWLQIDLGKVMVVTGFSTQGNNVGKQFYFNYSEADNTGIFKTFDLFARNSTTSADPEYVSLKEPILAQYIRFIPNGKNREEFCLNVELFGHDKVCSYPISSSEIEKIENPANNSYELLDNGITIRRNLIHSLWCGTSGKSFTVTFTEKRNLTGLALQCLSSKIRTIAYKISFVDTSGNITKFEISPTEGRSHEFILKWLSRPLLNIISLSVAVVSTTKQLCVAFQIFGCPVFHRVIKGKEGADLKIRCFADACPLKDVLWTKNRTFSVSTTPQLHFEKLRSEDAGLYECKASKETKDSGVLLIVEGAKDVVDGGYSPWANFGPCSASCGRGMKQRHRTCTAPEPQNNGKNCTELGPDTEINFCNIAPCVAESHVLSGFAQISPLLLPAKTLQIKQFSVEGSYYLGALSEKSLHIYKWDHGGTLSFKYQQALTVYNARSFDTFTYIVDHYMILAETVKHAHGMDFFTRVLSYNDVTKTFDFRKQIMLSIPFADKVIAFNVFGQPHAAFIQYQSKAPEQKIVKTICDQQSQKIMCSSGSSISIQSAFYGRNSWSVCNHGWFFNIRPCSAPLILEKIAILCDNKTECTLSAPPDGVVDPCPVFTKYLTVVYTCDKIMYKNVPRFYVWKSVGFQVIPGDTLVTYGATDIEAFALHHKHFVVVANHVNDEGSYHLDSEIFIYSSNLKRFVNFQRLRTDAALDWEFFSIGEGLAAEYFLAVANHFKLDKSGKRRYFIDSVIYKWNWNLFVPFQCIKSYGARKWSALKGSRGEFLLALSSNGNPNITFYEYDGWRFNPSTALLNPSFTDLGISTAYTLTLKNETMLLVHNPDQNKNANSDQGHLFRIMFNNAYPRYFLLNSTLLTLETMNQTLESLTNKLSNINRKFVERRSKLVFIMDNSTVSGRKLFTNAQVDGDLQASNVAHGLVHLSTKDGDFIRKHDKLQQRLSSQALELGKISKLSMQRVSKSKDQTIRVSLMFQNLIAIKNLETVSINISGTVNNQSLRKIAAETLYVDKDQKILRNKIFAGNLKIIGNLSIKGRIDEVNYTHIVTLHTCQVISGRKSFVGELVFASKNKHTNAFRVEGSLGGTTILKSKLMTVFGKQTVTGSFEFASAVYTRKDLEFVTINSLNLTALYDNAIFLATSQSLSDFKTFTFSLAISRNLIMLKKKTCDHVDISELKKKVLSRTESQEIAISIHFTNDILFTNILHVSCYVNAINISKHVVFLSKQNEIEGNICFEADTFLSQYFDVGGLVNGVNITGDLMTNYDNQYISGRQFFGNELLVQGNIKMSKGKTVDFVKLSSLMKEAVYSNLLQVISGDKIFSSMSAVNISLDCNCSSLLLELLTNLSKKTVKNDKLEFVKGTKIFARDVLMNYNLSLLACMNNINISKQLAVSNKAGAIYGKKHFYNTVFIKSSGSVKGYVNRINIGEMYDNAVRLHEAGVVKGAKQFLEIVNFEGDVTTKAKVNGIDIVKDLVKLADNESITAQKAFKSVAAIDYLTSYIMKLKGLIDGVNITDLSRNVLKKVGNNIVLGTMKFAEGFLVNGNIVSRGNLSGINLTALSLNSLKKAGKQTVTGKKVFVGSVTVKKYLKFNGLSDAVNLTKLAIKAVTLDGNQSVNGNLDLKSTMKIVENVDLGERINKINVTKIKEESLYLSGNQLISGIWIFRRLRAKGQVDMEQKMNGIKLSSDVVTLVANETLEKKIFLDLTIFKKHLEFNGILDGVNLLNLKNDTIWLFGPQDMEAKLVFHGDVLLSGNIHADGLINEVNVIALNLTSLSKRDDQVITGYYRFLHNLGFKNYTSLSHFINGINITDFKRNVVAKDAAHSMTGRKIFYLVTVDGLVVTNNLIVDGDLNDVNLLKVNRSSVRLRGKHSIESRKTFTTGVVFDKGIVVNETLNRIKIARDIVLISTNQTIWDGKFFEKDLIIEGNLNTAPFVTIDDLDISELAKNALYIYGNEKISSPVYVTNISAFSGIEVYGTINNLNVSRSNMLLKYGPQEVTGNKAFTEIFAAGSLSVHKEINGVDVQKLNRTSMFNNRNNNFTAAKEIIGKLIVRGNVSVTKLNDDRIINLQRLYMQASITVKTTGWRLEYATKWQQSTLKDYINSVKTLHQKLDFFIADEILILAATVDSFDAAVSNNSAIVIVLENQPSTNSSIYKKESPASKLVLVEKIRTHGSDVSMLTEGPIIYAAISTKESRPESTEQSTVFLFGTSGVLTIVAEREVLKKQANKADIVKFKSDALITFTSTYNMSSNKVCVFSTPTLINNTGILRPITSILGCDVKKVITRQIDSNSFLLVSLNAGLYGGREIAIYKVNINGNYSKQQRLPTFHAADAMLLQVKNDVFLIIANEYRISVTSFQMDYEVPVQIYRFNYSSNQFDWYQDLEAPGAMLLESFEINGNTYLVICSSTRAIKVFQFMGAGKFSMIDTVLSKGPINIKGIRSFTISGETYIALLSAVKSPSPQSLLRVFKAMKTASTSALEINRRLENDNIFPQP